MSFKRSNHRDRSHSQSRSNSPVNQSQYDGDNSAHYRSPHKSRRHGTKNSRRVYVANINFDATYDNIKSLFDLAGEVTFVQMLKDDSGRFKGCAVVTYSEPYMAESAIDELNRTEFKGRRLSVRKEEANPDFRARERQSQAGNDFEHSSTNPAATNLNTYGLSTSFLSTMGIELPLVSTIFVANLDYSVSESNLREVFGIAGKIMYCEIYKDKEGESRGFGIVEFEHPVEAVQAISMLHNQQYKERPLSVRLDRSERTIEGKVRLPPGLKSVGMGLGVNGAPLKDVRSLGMMNSSNSLIPSGIGATAVPSNSFVSQVQSLVPQTTFGGLGMMNSMVGGLGLPNASSLTPNYSNMSLSANKRRNNRSEGSFGNIIQIQNLPIDYSSDNLRKLCSFYGDVRLAEMTSQGVAMVKFNSESDAQRAFDALSKQSFDGRPLNVRLL